MKGPQPLLTLSDEKHLIRRTQQGDTEAFSPIVVKYHPRIYRHLLGRVEVPETAKDLIQEVWLRAYRGIQSFRGGAAFASWLYRIAENVCIDYFRRQKHRDTEPLHLIEEHHITETHTCPSQDILRQELREHLKNALECLSPYYHHELPIKAIASRLNRSEGTIKTHLRNARLQLQEILTPYLNNPDNLESV